MQPVWYPGDPESCQKYLPRQLMAKLSKETGFERPELEALWEQWTFMASTEWREDPDDLCLAMDRKTFERYLVPSGGYRHTAPNLLHDRIFAFYDTNNDDLIGFSEFLKGTAYRKRKDRLRKIFDGYDIDRDGYVNRRDFLRLFRAYYVLFNQMHRDILEGLDDQVMSSTEAHQLITSRQPLSSLFGREGGFPQADAGRPIEGKVVNVTTGDVSISDGKNRAVVEDRPDTEDRESMLTSLFSRQPHRHHDHNEPDHNSIVLGGPPSFLAESQIQMLTALLNPPTDVGELPALLVNGRREDDELMVMVNALNGQAESSDESGEDIAGDENRPDGGDNENADGQGQQAESPSGRGPSISYEGFITRGDSESDLPSGTQIREAYRRNPRLLSNSRIRANARRKLLERWKRRQFYLDEEEGALPPDGWEDDADVLQSLNGATENSNSAQPPVLSPRSRSSSKVRFAEDADDYETRSNPSTSSRSIPERWGGMDIPDAEKDAGKEIFYQVMQQAFNEILDILFKKKEDLAVKAAETKEDRDRYRSFFKDLDPTLEDRLAKHKAARQGEKTTTASQPRSRDEEGNIFAEMALPDLLSASGYSVDGTTQVDDEANEEVDAAGESADAGETEDTQPADESLSGQEDGGYRDPTMPQFRPNSWPTRSSEPDLIQPKLAPTSEKKASSSRNGKEPRDNVPAKEESATVSSENSSSSEKRGPDENRDSFDRQQLVEWKRLDLAEEEAKTRGGWGRLSYEEFEQIYRNEESRNSRLDYLGTWIDFCIPYH
ncbi:hypothetical protein B0H63DRAFT_458814 [Podospora didyma]|uniref:EF-hand domain-containing protein n=1 Tax=Podospora didyma TaxID=330526 RepID=A0AAE0U7G2_9PEZI|nr:hypothetical protein B0H63DRAFT_458814 [Podospora didyma]